MMLGLSQGPLSDLGLPYAGSWTLVEEGGTGAPLVSGGGFWESPGGVNWLNTLTRGTLAIVGSQVQRPTYETHTTPSGSSTVIRAGGGFNYPDTGPTRVPVAGVSTTTMLLLGVAAVVAVMVMAKR